MTKKNCIKPVAAVIGTAFVGSLSAVNVANAADNPFGATRLQSGYMVLASSHEGGEGKCGGKMKEGETKCGAAMKEGEGKEMKDGKCGEGKCGEGKNMEGKEQKDGKCGEGKCGEDKDKK